VAFAAETVWIDCAFDEIYGVTLYEVIAFPLLDGVRNRRFIAVDPDVVSVKVVGTLGIVYGVTAVLFEDAALVPTLFVAFTLNVTGVPFVRPLTVALVVIAPVAVAVFPLDDVTV
jgi:hypothetical protein